MQITYLAQPPGPVTTGQGQGLVWRKQADVGECQPLVHTVLSFGRQARFLRLSARSRPDASSTCPTQCLKPERWRPEMLARRPSSEKSSRAPAPSPGAIGGQGDISPLSAPATPRPRPVRAELDAACGNYRLSNMLKSVQLCLQCSRCLHRLAQN